MINIDSAKQQLCAVCSECNLLKVIISRIYIEIRLLFEVFLFVGENELYLEVYLPGPAAILHC